VDPAWPGDGRAVCDAAGGQGHPTITTDGAHGAVVAWTDSRAVTTSHIFAQHLLASGTLDPAWPENGRSISAAAEIETRPLAVADGAGGAVVTWQGFTVHLNIYAQHVMANGVVDPVWPAGGKALTDTDRTQSNPRSSRTARRSDRRVAGQRSNRLPAHPGFGDFDPAYPTPAAWPATCPAGRGPCAARDRRGGAIVAWTDGRFLTETSPDIFAVQLLAVGALDVPGPTPPALALGSRPNPARDHSRCGSRCRAKST